MRLKAAFLDLESGHDLTIFFSGKLLGYTPLAPILGIILGNFGCPGFYIIVTDCMDR